MSQTKIILSLRKHEYLFMNNDLLECIEKEKMYNTNELAILVIGMWSNHQCLVANRKLEELSPKVDSFLKKGRANNMKIIFGSSSLIKLPKYKLLRENMKNIPFANLVDKGLSFPPIPFNDSDGGINEKNDTFKRCDVDMNQMIEIVNTDAMTDNAKELLNYLYYHKIKLCLVVGVHTNMCVLDRPYGMKNIARYGFPMAIVRDLGDPMIKPDGIVIKDRDDAHEKIVHYVEQYFAPSINSHDLMIINEGKKIIRCDIDDTICKESPIVDTEDNHIYKRKEPIIDRINHMNQLYDEGHCIVYWTSRGCDSGKDWEEYTRKQLESWNVKYSGIICTKRRFDMFIDDKAFHSESYFKP
jgi:hypothetical protein